jgi:hypothetical protein
MLAASALDVVGVAVLADRGVLMAPIGATPIAVLLGAVVGATMLLDLAKAPLLGRLRGPTLARDGSG